MPIYAYRCAACGHAKDVLQKVSDPLLTICPACDQPAFAKQVTAAGFQLKGSGWYASDFKGGGAAADKATDQGAEKTADKAVDKPSDKTADKPADKSAAKAASPSAPAAPAAATPAAGQGGAGKAAGASSARQ